MKRAWYKRNRAPAVFQQQPRHMGPPGPGGPGGPGAPEGAMPPPTAPAEPHDNGPAAPATALVTTGPDGAPLDEGSQQSTLSNASAGMLPNQTYRTWLIIKNYQK